jgi:hypothetical protein
MEPATIDKQQLTREMAAELLHLVAPEFDGLTEVRGQLSLSVDQFRAPLGVPRDRFDRGVEAAGKVRLHELSASMKKTPLLATTVKVLAGRYGKNPGEVVRVARDADVRFQVRRGRMHFQGLRVGLPDVSPDLLVNSRGSIGLDRTLDVVLDVPRIMLNPADRSTAPLRWRVTGTPDRPIVTEIR